MIQLALMITAVLFWCGDGLRSPISYPTKFYALSIPISRYSKLSPFRDSAISAQKYATQPLQASTKNGNIIKWLRRVFRRAWDFVRTIFRFFISNKRMTSSAVGNVTVTAVGNVTVTATKFVNFPDTTCTIHDESTNTSKLDFSSFDSKYSESVNVTDVTAKISLTKKMEVVLLPPSSSTNENVTRLSDGFALNVETATTAVAFQGKERGIILAKIPLQEQQELPDEEAIKATEAVSKLFSDEIVKEEKQRELLSTFPEIVSEQSVDPLYMSYETGEVDSHSVAVKVGGISGSVITEDWASRFASVTSEKGLQNAKNRIKSAGVGGAISYALTEATFWLLSFPVIAASYHSSTGEWLNPTNDADRVRSTQQAIGVI